jgi:predicted MPP superfamily phosphohydrolase
MINRRQFLNYLFLSAGAGLTGGTIFSAYRSNSLEIVREKIHWSKPIGKLRIVLASDIHAPSLYNSITKLISVVNNESPDIFILVGDIIDKCGMESMVSKFSHVNTRVAKLAVLGNWEHRSKLNLSLLNQKYANAGVQLLVNSTIEVAGMLIVGLDDLIGGNIDLGILKPYFHNNIPILLLSHCPGVFDLISTLPLPPTLVLSGHTHGGQIAPFGIALVKPPGSGSYIKGWYHKGNHSLYVMRGVGTSGLPFRIGARPELLVLDLES